MGLVSHVNLLAISNYETYYSSPVISITQEYLRMV